MASLMAIWNAIVFFLKEWPQLKKFIVDVIAFVQNILNNIQETKNKKQLQDAVKESKETKDTSKLEDLFPHAQSVSLVSNLKVSFAPVQMFPSDIQMSAESIQPSIEVKKKTLTLSSIATGFSTSFKSMGFGSNQGSVDLTDSTQINTNYVSGTGRMSSKFLSVIVIALLLLNGCKSTAVNQPSFQPKIFAGDSRQAAIVRKQSNELIPANSEEFDDYAAVSYSDLACLMKTYVMNCEKYKKAVVDCSDLDPKDARFEVKKQK